MGGTIANRAINVQVLKVAHREPNTIEGKVEVLRAFDERILVDHDDWIREANISRYATFSINERQIELITCAIVTFWEGKRAFQSKVIGESFGRGT